MQKGGRSRVHSGLPPHIKSASYSRSMDPDVGMVYGHSRTPPTPSHTGPLHNDGRKVRYLPACPTSGIANPFGRPSSLGG